MSGELILTVNAGSSSIKFAVFGPGDAGDPVAIASGKATNIGSAGTRIDIRDGAQAVLLSRALPDKSTQDRVLPELLEWIEGQYGAGTLRAAGHRIVHGGLHRHAPVRLTDELVDELAALSPLVPLHQPHNIAPVRILARDYPDLPQFACFDTGFHASITPLESSYAIPRAMTEQGLRRYGFHGLSYEYIADCLPEYLGQRADGRVVVAHLGNGASMCAMRERKSVATTMGFSALDGLVMGTRCGAIDPGLLLYLMQSEGMDAAELTDLLYRRSGLLGVSGTSNDMQALLASDEPAAREAVAMFAYRAAREIGSLATALGGIDALVFTAGIGEHAAPVRAAICQRSQWLGIELDAPENARHGPRISTQNSPVAVFVVPTDEDRMIARHCLALLTQEAAAHH